MRQTMNQVLTSLYAVAMIVFLVLAFGLVLTQAAGLFFGQGQWIAGASEALLRPAIITAVVAGLFGFAVFNVRGTSEKEQD
ncbi:hypothetical protein [Zhihengliuella flava]|uniref:Uncharacterized protein n=1 Tax=Zhihengliuella flava TaxID=1285193 RepID=A0A931DAV5_9MICC|nr:hypothetical protein [Zhihengliuella flava]MBG6085092.1 hypothetical protein [Zhihengliuella flava]